MTFSTDLYTFSGLWGLGKTKKHHGVVMPTSNTVFIGFNIQVRHDRLVPSEPGRWSWRLEREGGQRPIRSSTKQDNIPTGKSHTHTRAVSSRNGKHAKCSHFQT